MGSSWEAPVASVSSTPVILYSEDHPTPDALREQICVAFIVHPLVFVGILRAHGVRGPLGARLHQLIGLGQRDLNAMGFADALNTIECTLDSLWIGGEKTQLRLQPPRCDRCVTSAWMACEAC